MRNADRPRGDQERRLRTRGFSYIAGVDEVGRGPWAGPIVAAAVILPMDISIVGIRDSKLLTEQRRESLYDDITRCALSWSVSFIDPKIIDAEGISFANGLAIRQAIGRLTLAPDIALIDGLSTWNVPITSEAIVDGDSKILSIAAASIIAKVTRDRFMIRLHTQYPMYRFDRNKGYGTEEHRTALQRYGPSPHHRRSFRPLSLERKNP